MKANASHASEHLEKMQEEPGAYWERLDRYEEEVWRLIGKGRKKRANQMGQTQDTQMSKPHGPGSWPHEAPGKPRG